ncbi:MAG TPA: cobalamin-dependent protein [Myxococcota bacterium]|nr:cobalamin-dependent protein [Myxococcota bacterium]HRY94071.1 cobalamin-dependent protein [Myxococcota bacterium]
MRIRLVHLPRLGPDERLPRGAWINVMPVGLLALADVLDRGGHDVQVWHAGVEARVAPPFELAEALARERAEVVGLSLHWHPQLPAVEAAVQAIRRRLPEVRLVLGGMTATWFAEELLTAWPGVDAVLRGEAERSLVRLVELWAKGRGDLEEVPGLSWRRGGARVHNRLGPPADRPQLDSLDFARLDLLRHGGAYNAQFAPVDGRFENPPVFYLCPGRGCSRRCAFCGGGRGAHSAMSGRRGVVFRSPGVVARELARVARQGVRDFCVCFDPPPASAAFYPAFFEAVRRQALEREIGLVFECFQPPPRAFLEDLARTFQPARSRLFFSPTVADETLRRRILGYGYPNREVERALRECEALGLATSLYFAAVPQETEAQLEASLAWQAALVSRHSCQLIHSALEIEPGAPWGERPGRFGLTHVRRGFAAFRARHLELGQGLCAEAEVGYAFPGLDARLVRVRSALSAPLPDAAQALAGNGRGTDERILMVGPERLEEGLRLVSAWRGSPCRLHLAGRDELRADRALLRRLAEALGPAARLVPLETALVSHQRWSAERTRAAGGGGLRVLHLAGDQAARTAVAWLRRPVPVAPAGWVLADVCRWLPGICPARGPRLVALSSAGGLRTCSSSPALAGRGWAGIQREIQAWDAGLELRRGCQECPVRTACCRCPQLGQVSEAVYCELWRALGLTGLGPAGWSMVSAPRPPALGWDG